MTDDQRKRLEEIERHHKLAVTEWEENPHGVIRHIPWLIALVREQAADIGRLHAELARVWMKVPGERERVEARANKVAEGLS